MRLVKNRVARDGSGSVTLRPVDPEDMWSAYNLIRTGDLLRAPAVRRVTTESATRSDSSRRVHVTLSIRVKGMTFDQQAAQLHVAGEIDEENAYAAKGQHHTLDLELQRDFTLEKPLGGWDSINVALLQEACAPGRGVSAWVVVMQEGLANIAVLMGERTVLKQRVNMAIPTRRGDSKSHDQAVQKFFDVTLATLLRHIDLSADLPILLASPAYTATQFQKFILEYATRTGNKALLAQKNNFLLVHTSTGHVHSLSQVLGSPAVRARLSDTRFARETQLMDSFGTLLRQDEGRAWYGPREVERAIDAGAVGRGGGVLLISDSLFRAEDLRERRRWVSLVERVRDQDGGEARVLSSEHESGRRLAGLGGVAAILTYPLYDLDESADEDDGAPTPVDGDLMNVS